MLDAFGAGPWPLGGPGSPKRPLEASGNFVCLGI